MLDFLLELLGWSAAIVLIPSLWAQIYRNYKRKSCEGLSLLAFSTLFYGMAGLLVVNLLTPTPVVWNIINFSNGALSSLIILIQMYCYRKNQGGRK